MQLGVALFLLSQPLLFLKRLVLIEGLLGPPILEVVLFTVVGRLGFEIGSRAPLNFGDVLVHQTDGPVPTGPLFL